MEQTLQMHASYCAASDPLANTLAKALWAMGMLPAAPALPPPAYVPPAAAGPTLASQFAAAIMPPPAPRPPNSTAVQHWQAVQPQPTIGYAAGPAQAARTRRAAAGGGGGAVSGLGWVGPVGPWLAVVAQGVGLGRVSDGFHFQESWSLLP